MQIRAKELNILLVKFLKTSCKWSSVTKENFGLKKGNGSTIDKVEEIKLKKILSWKKKMEA